MVTVPLLLHDLLDRRAALTPDAPALRAGDTTLTYRELGAAGRAAARWLRGHGVGRGDRVLVVDDNDPQTLVLAFAASRIGAAYVIVGARIRPYLLEHVLADARPAAVVARGEVAVAARAGTEMPVLSTDSVPMTGADGDPALGFGPPALPTDPVSLIYTSGSTALPKAVVSTHQQVLFAVDAIGRRLAYRADDVLLGCLPLSFDYGLYQGYLSCAAGATLVLGRDADAGPGLLRRLRADRVTVLPLVPSLAAGLCALLERSPAEPPPLRLVTNTGAALAPALAARMRALVPGLAVVAMFGLTECKRVSIADPDEDLRRPGSAGRALPGTEIWVIGPDGERLPPGEVGELVVAGPHVMAGYWNAPELSARRFRRDYLGRTHLHSGDRVRLDAEGHLYFVGREDEVYKQNGFRVSTAEVEAAAADVPGVRLAGALAPDGDQPARLAVATDLTPQSFLKELRARLEDARIPPAVLVLDALPLTANGKIDRKGLHRCWTR